MKWIAFLLLFGPALLQAQGISSTVKAGDANIFNDAIERYIEYRYGNTGRRILFLF